MRGEGLENPESAVEFMSLSAAPLAGIGENVDSKNTDSKNAESENAESENNDAENATIADSQQSSNVINHALAMMSDILEPAYGFKSLYFFKKKFQPEASSVYVCYLDSAKLAQISLAVTHAYLPEASAKQILEMAKSLRPKTSELNK